ncbi:MAG TPA: hypothetical protein PLE19_04890 [Planctomycetota bacterium]|nr:hypothetical protein [Planctomycetota bacterium]HRR82908.1 hypothetical protein [Planctomycetota bacterium]HRT93142.1 hypothetical protein [Planctomycetota bacterium]
MEPKRSTAPFVRLAFTAALLAWAAASHAGEKDPFEDLEKPKREGEGDPFEDIEAPKPPPEKPAPPKPKSWTDDLFGQNFTFKREIMLQTSYSDGELYNRHSVGFEVLKKWSTPTATVAAFNAQFRFVRRDNPIEVSNDGEGMEREGWYGEFHNFYLDLYNVFNPLMSDEAKGAHLGRFNFRIGRFYLPMGLNLQTDTHGTVLQLSNERNFGFERDWYAGFWGTLNPYLNYDLYYLLGSGYYPKFKGQSGMVGARVSLADSFNVDYGLQGGVALMAGERLSEMAVMRSPSVAMRADGDVVDTFRAGLDARYRRTVPTGWLTFTFEGTAGRDERDDVLTQLYEAEYLHRSRKVGVAAQFRRFWQDIGRDPMMPGMKRPDDVDSSVALDLTYYFRNDITQSNLHWVKLNIERQLQRQMGSPETIITLQYYRYW